MMTHTLPCALKGQHIHFHNPVLFKWIVPERYVALAGCRVGAGIHNPKALPLGWVMSGFQPLGSDTGRRAFVFPAAGRAVLFRDAMHRVSTASRPGQKKGTNLAACPFF
jgi:hypothetical protein